MHDWKSGCRTGVEKGTTVPFSCRRLERIGGAAFTYEVLEQKDAKDITDVKWALKQMEKPWLQKLQPYGDRGYNKPPKE